MKSCPYAPIIWSEIGKDFSDNFTGIEAPGIPARLIGWVQKSCLAVWLSLRIWSGYYGYYVDWEWWWRLWDTDSIPHSWHEKNPNSFPLWAMSKYFLCERCQNMKNLSISPFGPPQFPYWTMIVLMVIISIFLTNGSSL